MLCPPLRSQTSHLLATAIYLEEDTALVSNHKNEAPQEVWGVRSVTVLCSSCAGSVASFCRVD